VSADRSAGLSGYRALPRIAGWDYLVATSLGRLPMSMVPLAILTLATSATGSVAVGGLAAAAAALGEAVGAPVAGLLADRRGQRPVLLCGAAVHLALLVVLAFGAGAVPDAATVALAGLTGLTLPQVGALSRARWLAMSPDDTRAAFAFEGVADEIVYVIGPAAVGLLAVAFDPRIALLVAGALVAVFVTRFATHRSHLLVPRGIRVERAVGADAAAPGSRSTRLLIVLVLAGAVCMGVFFGGSQAALTAFAARAGIPDAGALLYSVMAVGSAVTTVAMVLVPDRIGAATRWCAAAAGMVAGAVLLLSAGSVPAVVAAGVLAGAFQGPMLLTLFGIVGSVAVRGRGGTIMTLMSSGIVVGIAIGSAAAGALGQAGGPAAAFAVVLTAASVLLLLGLASTPALRRHARRA
jgi:MFS family permease